jgi:hypothetical protein
VKKKLHRKYRKNQQMNQLTLKVRNKIAQVIPVFAPLLQAANVWVDFRVYHWYRACTRWNLQKHSGAIDRVGILDCIRPGVGMDRLAGWPHGLADKSKIS